MKEPKRQAVVELLKEEASELHQELSAIEAMIDFINKQSASLEKFAEPYRPNASYTDKILYVLNLRGDSLTKDLVAFIKEQEPELDLKGLSLNIGKAASRLVRDRKIKVTKEKNSNRYSLGR